MASNINPYNIDGTYPIAGQDNSSQGFRDNFTNIKNNLTYAAAEITDLQSKAVLTSALTGGTLTNNMAGSVLQAPQLLGFSETLVDKGSVSGAQTIDFSEGNVQKITPSASVSLAFTNFPTAGSFGAVRLWVTVTNIGYTLTLPITAPGVTKNLDRVNGLNPATGVLTFKAIGDYLLEFSTIDSGVNIYVTEVAPNTATFNGNVIVSNVFVPSSSSTSTGISGQVSYDSGNLYVCIGPGNWKKAALTTF